MGCSPSTEEEEDRVAIPIRQPIDAVRATHLLYLQELLMRSRLRGDARDVTRWVMSGALPIEVANNAQAVGFLVFEGHLKATDSNFELLTHRYGSKKRLDDRDFLRDEIASKKIRGTCCAIGDHRILTAAHVIDKQEKQWLADNKLCVLFGFAKQIDGLTHGVFDPTAQKAKVLPPEGFDPAKPFDDEWLELEIDRSMSDLGGRRPAVVSDSALVDGGSVYTFGHPNGLSLRFAMSPTTVPGPESGCFRAYVDGYGGASGSPIFDSTTHRIVGLALASGQKLGTVRITELDSLSQVCTPLTSRGVSCRRRPIYSV